MEGEVFVGAAMVSLMPAAFSAEWVEVPKAAIMGEVTGYGGVHGGLGVFELGFVKEFGVFGLFFVRTGEEEFFFAVFLKDFDEFGEVLVAKEYFAFAVLYVVLQVEGDGLGGAEVLHRVGDIFTELFGEAEEVVDGVFAVEDNSGIVGEVDTGFAKF